MNTSNDNRGWVKLHRSILNWEWWDEPMTAHLFIHCLLKANPTDMKWHGETIKRGSFVTSRATLVKETGMSDQQIRTAIDHLISTNEITKKVTNKQTYITITNYNNYQEVKPTQQPSNQPNNQPTNNQQITSKQPTYKEYKNERNIISSTTPPNNGYNIKCDFEEDDEQEGKADAAPQPPQAPTPQPPPPENLHGCTYDTTENHYARYREELTTETLTSDAAIRTAKICGKELTRQQLGEYLDRFQDTLRASGDTHTTHSDYRRHFTCWLRKIITIEITPEQPKYRANYGTRNQTTERPRQIADASQFVERL